MHTDDGNSNNGTHVFACVSKREHGTTHTGSDQKDPLLMRHKHTRSHTREQADDAVNQNDEQKKEKREEVREAVRKSFAPNSNGNGSARFRVNQRPREKEGAALKSNSFVVYCRCCHNRQSII